MADVRAAILSAAQAADKMHHKYRTRDRVEAGEGRVDVFDMLVQQDVDTMFQRLDKLLGAFLDEGGEKGVIVTTQRQLPVQRFTAAHELGHVVLGHQPSADLEEILSRSPYVEREDRGYDIQEIQANVFASQLLIPRWLLIRHMQRQSWTAPDLLRSEVVYQLSLRLGASYSATCHALQQNRVISPTQCDQLLSVTRRGIKEKLSAPYTPANRYGDVWVVTERDDGILLEGSKLDLVVVKLQEHSGSGYLWRLDDLAKAGFAVVEDSRQADPDTDLVGGVTFRTVIAESKTGATGHVSLKEVRPWQAKGTPLHSLEMEVDLSGPVQTGLHKAQRRKALQGAA